MVNGEKIKELMKEKGISGKELADKVGVSAAMISYIIKGFREPNVAALARIAQTLDCTVDELLVK